ncbi:MAG: excinuclease ABC subunit C [Halobacteriaceae archaeon]
MDAAAVRSAAADLPRDPGVYQFIDGDEVLYIGKALELRDRIRSYADPRSERIARMRSHATDVEVSVTDTETQALLLEANLIKRHQPRYNVRLKDDKSYPLVQLTDHEFPRIVVTRDPADGGQVFGPYTDVGRVETVVKAIREVFGVRGCSDHKFRGRDRPCLDYEMGLCSAPCTGEIGADAYIEDVAAVERFFTGDAGVLLDPLETAMDEAASAQAFERAANLRDRVRAVEQFHGGRAAVVADESGTEAVDVLGVAIDGEDATVARLHSDGGQLVDRSRHAVSIPAEEQSVAAVLSAFLTQYYAERSLPDAVVLQEPIGDPEVEQWLEDEGVAVRVPGAGREARLVDLALKNASRRPAKRDELGALASALGIDRPERIEALDVSHAQGTAVVGSDVTLVDGAPETDDYRRKKLTEGNDDVARMRALVQWRAKRALEGRDDRPDPDLLVIDGGRPQLGAAREVLDAEGWSVPVLALAKDEEVVYTPDSRFDWPQDAPQLHVLQRARDEAHRFAVQYHQTVRDDVSTALDSVSGVGPALRRRLLRRFGSVEGVRNVSETELMSVEGIGERRAETLARRL